VIGIGAQKCASTWLYGVLEQMPDVCISAEKEVDFFNAYFDRGYEWYERHFAARPGARHRGEISPNYFIDFDAPARIAAYNPAAHLLVTLRDPVARAFSSHLHEVRKGHVSGDNLRFETALENNPLYLEQGFYARHLERWLAYFPRAQIHVFFQETISADPAGEALRLAHGLDLLPIENLLARRENESVVYRNPLLGETLWKVSRFARRNGLGRAVEIAKSAPMIRSLRNANRKAVKDTVPPMLPETEARLTEFYVEDVSELAALIGTTPPWPRFAPPQRTPSPQTSAALSTS
jgi:hypothetical protein